MNGALSVYLDLARFMAAVIVFVTHASFERFGGTGLHGLGNHAHEAVILFFVLSGFVISYVTDQKEKTLHRYMVSRLARLYSVALPALLLVALLDYSGHLFDSSQYADACCQYSYPLLRLLINALFLNELWFESVRPFSNAPYWSLGYEFWYYVLFACFSFFHGRKRWLLLAVVILMVGPSILLLLPVWAMGAWLYRYVNGRSVPEVAGWVMFIASFAGYLLYRSVEMHAQAIDLTVSLLGGDGAHALQWSRAFWSDWFLGLLICMNFAGFFGISGRISRWLSPLRHWQFEQAVRYCAGMTFSLYLFHYPLLQFLAAVSHNIDAPWRNALVMAATFVIVWLLSLFTERKKNVVRHWVDRLLSAIVPGAREARL